MYLRWTLSIALAALFTRNIGRTSSVLTAKKNNAIVSELVSLQSSKLLIFCSLFVFQRSLMN